MLLRPRSLRLFLAILLTSILLACGGGGSSSTADSDPTPLSLTLEKIAGFDGTVVGAAEIVAFDASSKRLFVVNGANGNVDVLDLSSPSSPRKVGVISVAGIGAGVNSVDTYDGLVALAVEASPKTSPGRVAFYDARSLDLLAQVTVGALPDMVVFTPDGANVLVANEGEPNSYGQPDSVDPEGSVSIIAVNRIDGGIAPTVRTAVFTPFNTQIDTLRSQGVRVFGPNATVAQDLEPEYIAVAADSRTAYVTLQENNAIATLDIGTATFTAIRAMGTKDHSITGSGLDPSDEDSGVNTNSGGPAVKIGTWPVRGMYLPDGMALYSVNGITYLITANEGDARADWPGFNEETRIRTYCTNGLDPTVFPGATGTSSDPLLFDSNLGRLRITSAPNGGDTGKNSSGQCTKLWAYGARSFSIWNASGPTLVRVFDSGDAMEQRTTNLANVPFNASNDNATLDSRSPNKGPEPEGVTVARFGNKVFAFIGLERVGGVMVYDVTTPSASTFVTYVNTRTAGTGDRGPEGIHFVPASSSPNGKPLLLVGNETSGTTTIFQINLTF